MSVHYIILYKNTNHQQTHKDSFIISRNTLLHVSTVLGHLQGELFVIVTLRLHFTVEWECAVDCVLCTGGVNCLRFSAGRDRREFTPPKTTRYTVNSTFSLNYKDCVLEAWALCGAVQAGTAESSRLQKQCSTQSTAHSHSTIKCNLSVTITKRSPWWWPSRVETCRSVLRLMIKLSLCICWWLVFLYNIVHGYGTH
jgi:hypothetical protein